MATEIPQAPQPELQTIVETITAPSAVVLREPTNGAVENRQDRRERRYQNDRRAVMF